MNKIRVLIADDHAVFREGLRLLLAESPDIEVVGEAVDGIDALEKTRELRPEVVLLDIAMPRMNGLDAIKVIRDAVADTRIVILSMYEKEEYVHEALSQGAQGYVLKGSPSQEVVQAIRHAHQGQYYLSSKMQGNVIESYIQSRKKPEIKSNYDLLSAREKQVFRLLVEGNSTNRISEILCISAKTVETHRTKIAKKIGLSNPIDLVKYAVRIGVLKPDFWESS